MRKTLKALIALCCVLLAVAIALLIYLEFGKPNGNDPSTTEPTGSVTSTETDGITETEGTGITQTEGTNSTESTEEAPLETREGGVPNYNWSEEETTPDTVPEQSGTSGEAEPYVPDEDELPQLPI